jgi:hypothetical protein
VVHNVTRRPKRPDIAICHTSVGYNLRTLSSSYFRSHSNDPVLIMPLGKPYKGFQKKLIIAFDVGTTFSGVSYAVLIPEEQPSIQGVTK